MPFARPALPDLIARVQMQLGARIQAAAAPVLRALTAILGTVLGQELSLEYGYLTNIAAQFFIRTAAGGYLDDRANPYGLFRTQAATSAGPATATGIAGFALPAGSVAQTAAGGVTFVVAATTVLGAGPTAITLTATTGGVAGNLPAGTALTLVNAIPGVNATLTVTAPGLLGGLDLESDANFRIRLLARTGQPPQGGARNDYVAWAKLVPGATRAWTFPGFYGLGTVAVAPVYDGRAPGSIIPTGTDLAAAQAILDADSPVIGQSYAIALASDPIAVTIHALTPTAGFTQAQAFANATDSLEALFAAVTPGGTTAGDGIVAGVTPGVVFVTDISDAIKQSAGVATFDLPAPTADYTAALGHLPVLGAVTLT